MSEFATRRLTKGDLQRAIEIDGHYEARPRRGYFESRLAAALRNPDAYVQIGVTLDDKLVGMVLANIRAGEYGQDEVSLAMEVIGVDPDYAGQGVGDVLMDALETEMRRIGIAELETEVRWTNHRLLTFLDRQGFEIAPRQILAAAVTQDLAEPREEI